MNYGFNKTTKTLIIVFIFLSLASCSDPFELEYVPLCGSNTPFSCQDGGSYLDTRDGREYKIVEIDNICWFAENLNYGEFIAEGNGARNGTIDKRCYKNDRDSCLQRGGYYNWNEAFPLNSCEEAPRRGICPPGTHIPSKEEFEALIGAVGGMPQRLLENGDSGFNMLLTGFGITHPENWEKEEAWFLTSTPEETSGNQAYAFQYQKATGLLRFLTYNKEVTYACIRCVVD